MFDLISAALAFAITMFFLSTVSTVLVETIHRFLQQREKGLELMLGHLYDRVIAANLGGNAEAYRERFVELMSVNRAPTGAGLASGSDLKKDDKAQDRWTWLWNGRRLGNLGVNDFINRLGSSEFGDALRTQVAEGAHDAVIKDIAAKFEAFGAEASAFFQSRARLFSVLVSIGMAYMIYVHPAQLFQAYLNIEGLSEKVIALDNLTASPDEATRKTAKETIKELKDLKVPLGWDDDRLKAGGFWMWDKFGVPIPVPCFGMSGGGCTATAAQFPTLVWLVIGGLLVGLGGPFWKQIIDQLTPMRAKGKGEDSAKTGGSSGGASQPSTPVEHFNTGAAGRDAAGAPANADTEEKAVG
jgi:hypothetical protein